MMPYFRLRDWTLLAIIFGLVAAGCSNGGDANVITLNVPANVSLLQTLQAKLPDFEARHDVRVKLMPFSGQEKLFAMLAAGQPPDIFYTNTVVRDQLAAEGRLLDLRTIAGDDPFVARVRPEFIARGSSIDGGWYQFCDWTYTFAVYFNKALFDQHGVAYPDSAWTWQGMLDRARQLTRDTDGDGRTDQYGIFIARHFVAAIERMNGADYPPNALFFDLAPASRQALQAYLDLIYRHGVMPELAYVQAQGMQLSQMLNSGRIAMAVEALPNLDVATALKIDWDVAPLPRMAEAPPRYFRSASGGLSISSTCRQPGKAWELVKWLVTESPYNTPNPVLADVDFIEGWQARHPDWRDKHFAQVWRLSEQFDGGDIRDFVRYFSWSTNTILEQLNPKLDLLFAGKVSLDDIEAAGDAINQQVVRELRKVLANPNLQPAFRERIREMLQQHDIPISD